MHVVKVNQKAANRFASGHPWIFTTDVVDRGSAEGGEAVHVYSQQGRPLGTAHYSSSSQITLRRISEKLIEPDRAFYEQAISAALAHRKRFVLNSDAYRAVSAEGDLLPGLIVDVYGDQLVIQTLTQGMDRIKSLVIEILEDLLHPAAILERNDAPVRQKEELPQVKGVVQGVSDGTSLIHFNGLAWKVDLLGGQKTGVYLDQRENYEAAARWGRGNALDCFTSTGGFALHLARVCDSVEGVDSSAHALATAQENASRNQLSNLFWREADVFDLLASYSAKGRRFDTVVLDPPAFAKSRSALEAATKGYRDINQRAIRLLNTGGTLITCSCSHHFSEAMLFETVAEAALDAGKNLRVLERRAQAQDHPILLTVPETLYLKCLIFEVL